MNQHEIKKLNKEKIKKYKKQLRSEKFDVDNEIKYNTYDEAIIECKIGDTQNLFSPYDISKDRTINDEFDRYLMEETDIIPLKENLEVKIHLNKNCDEESQNQITSAIKRYYSFKITKSKVELKKNRIMYSILYIIGILFLFVTPFASKINSDFPVSELLLILIWFCLWEASDILLFKCGGLKNTQINMLRIYNAKFTYIKDSPSRQKNSKALEKTIVYETTSKKN